MSTARIRLFIDAKSALLIIFACTGMIVLGAAASASAQAVSAVATSGASPQKVIFDTDIGDDIDDAFAITLALQSPEVQIVGIDTAWGDTPRRARLVEHLLRDAGRTEIPVNAGVQRTLTDAQGKFTQGAYADAEPPQQFGNAVDFLLEQAKAHPGEITLVAIGPLSNIGAAIDRDPATFRKLKRVVIMGGSIYRGYEGTNYPIGPNNPMPEWNILNDPSAAQKLFASGVPLYVMPLDSTQIRLQEVERNRLFSAGTPITNALTILSYQWFSGSGQSTPTLFDVVAAAYAIRPELCPTKPMRIRVDDRGNTLVENGQPNANVCLRSNSDQFFEFLMPRLLAQPIKPNH